MSYPVDTILAAMDEAVLVIGPDYTIRYLNASACALVGMDAQQAIGRTCYELLKEGAGACLRSENVCPVHQVFVDGKRMSIVRQLHSEGGRRHACRISASPVFGAAGEVEAVVEVIKRIPDKEISSLLTDRAEMYSRFFESIPEAVLTIDSAHRIVDATKAAEYIFGCPPETLIGRIVTEIMPAEFAQWLDQRKKCCDGSATITKQQAVETVITSRPGGPLAVEFSLSCWQSGGRIFCSAIIRDVSERRRLQDTLLEEQQQLKESRQELSRQHDELQEAFVRVEQAKVEWERTMDCVSDMVFLTDSGGRIRRCNRSFTDFIGRKYLEVIGTQWHKLLKAHGIKVDAMDRNESVVVHQPSGRSFILSLYNYGHKDFTGFVISLQDVTEQRRITREIETKNLELENAYGELKRTQARVLQQEKMASIGVLAAGVAHEINNPIGFVSSNLGMLQKYLDRLVQYIDFLQKHLEARQDENTREESVQLWRQLKLDFVLADSRDLISESLEGAARVCKIVQDLKGFSRVDRPERSFANVNDLLESTITIAWNELKYKVELVRNYGEVPDIECFPQQLNQVFMNLLVNASQAISENGTITVTTWSDEEGVGVSIADTGCGMDEVTLKRIFEPFFTTKEVGKGTGLGLSIVYEIIAVNHRGRIWATSEKGKGSTFTMSIPLRTDMIAEGQSATAITEKSDE